LSSSSTHPDPERPSYRPGFAHRAALAASLLAAAFTACRDRDATPQATDAPAHAEVSSPAAEAYYRTWGCSICHGIDRRGGKNAPSLERLDASWSVASLADYMLDPARFRESDARIRKLAARYPKMTMPPTDQPEPERRTLAAWLLAGSH
jgi:cytochrome c553